MVLSINDMVDILNKAKENGEDIYINHPSAGKFTPGMTADDITMVIFGRSREEQDKFKAAMQSALSGASHGDFSEIIKEGTDYGDKDPFKDLFKGDEKGLGL